MTRTVDGRPYCLAITDTAGQEEYRGLWTSSTLHSDAFLLVYDITNPSSLETLDSFLEMIGMEAEQRLEDNERLRQAGAGPGRPPPVMIVAGNKCDLKDSRAVSSRDGLAYARRHGCGFMETSAREMVNIEETFARMFPIFLPSAYLMIDEDRIDQFQIWSAGSSKPAACNTTALTIPLSRTSRATEVTVHLVKRKTRPPGDGNGSDRVRHPGAQSTGVPVCVSLANKRRGRDLHCMNMYK